MEDEYSLQIDNALATLAEKIGDVNKRIDNLSVVDLPTDVIEMYAKAKVVDTYVSMGVPVQAALAIVGIEVPLDMLSNASEKTIETDDIVEGYQSTMRSLQASIEALKAVFDYSKMYDDEKAMEEEDEEESIENEDEETTEAHKPKEDSTKD